MLAEATQSLNRTQEHKTTPIQKVANLHDECRNPECNELGDERKCIDAPAANSCIQALQKTRSSDAGHFTYV